MSNITLSAGIRQNLLSLQGTAANLTTTQEHLSTGKKVNTAFDNPTSYFTSQSLNNRANDLSALLDQIGQGQQTLDAANNGLTSMTSLLEQALSTVQQAQQTTPTAAAVTTGSVALTSLNAGGNLLVNVGANTYTVAITASEALSSIESQINAVSGLGANGAVTASDDGSGHLVLTGNTNTTAFTIKANAESLALGVTTSATVDNAVAQAEPDQDVATKALDDRHAFVRPWPRPDRGSQRSFGQLVQDLVDQRQTLLDLAHPDPDPGVDIALGQDRDLEAQAIIGRIGEALARIEGSSRRATDITAGGILPGQGRFEDPGIDGAILQRCGVVI